MRLFVDINVCGAFKGLRPRSLRRRERSSTLQRDVSRVRPAFETIDNKGQPGAAFGQVGCIDLRDVTQANDLGTRSCPRDQRFHLFGRQVLRLVE